VAELWAMAGAAMADTAAAASAIFRKCFILNLD
jgi:hypothetical protein